MAKPCVKRGDCRFDEGQYVKANPAFVRADGEEAVRTHWRLLLAHGIIPPKCDKCGFHHHPTSGENAQSEEK